MAKYCRALLLTSRRPMNILLPPNSLLFWSTLLAMSAMLVAALWLAPWRQLAASQSRQHVFFAAIIALSLLWLLHVRVQGIFAFHPMLITVITMVFGLSLALLIGVCALVLLEFYQLAVRHVQLDWHGAWQAFDLRSIPVDFCVGIAVPAAWAWCVLWLVNGWKFKNPFTYFLGVGFFGAMVGCLLMGSSAWLLFTLTNSLAHQIVVEEYFFVFFLMTFPEGFINGTIATALTVLAPDLVKTYRDDWFLKD
ncbi:putative membrane protein [Cellvibrio japonicus Ueda107]|uniref:Putative membrane protein n=2 Tax=Cellvibrio japonicus TaxID=155077 RepID=B3PB76_CELJU|nr:putative membrane protein [Cellvibrio japonicus Ueda107]